MDMLLSLPRGEVPVAGLLDMLLASISLIGRPTDMYALGGLLEKLLVGLLGVMLGLAELLDGLDRLDGDRLRTLSQGLPTSSMPSSGLDDLDSLFLRLNMSGEERRAELSRVGMDENRSELLSSRYCLPPSIILLPARLRSKMLVAVVFTKLW